MTSLKIATWNINGLSPNISELEAIITLNKLDIVLISESHSTSNNTFSMRGFKIYHTPHPDGTSHAGSAIVIKNSIKHSLIESYSTDYLQATSVRTEDRSGPLNLSAIYCPPKHKVSDATFSSFFESLGPRFLVGGDWNAKHEYFGSRITSTRGRNLKKCIDANHLRVFSTGEPTHWPTDSKKLPDLIDFFISKNISDMYTCIESSLDGSSDHTLVILTLSSTITLRDPPESLYNRKTDWQGFKEYLESNIVLSVPLKSADDVDNACLYITNLIQVAAWTNTPELKAPELAPTIPMEIRLKLEEKRRLRRIWHLSHSSVDKKNLNYATKELKELIHDSVNLTIKKNLELMSPQGNDDHSLWKATRNLTRPQQSFPPLKNEDSWLRTDCEKAEAFAEHLASVFKPNEGTSDDSEIDEVLYRDFQMCVPIRSFSPREITREIKSLDKHKAPGFDLITPLILKELPNKVIVFLANIFNAILRTSHFPTFWKFSEIIMIHKAGKPEHLVSSYRPISLTPILSKLWERTFLTRLKDTIDNQSVIPSHQFGFRQSHSTIEQVHRVYQHIRKTFEGKEYCSAAFLDIQQAFDRVWHKGLLCKIKLLLPHSFFLILESYLSNRIFRVKQGNARSSIHNISAGVPQGSVLGPVLYNIFTSDMPTSSDVTVATYADDIAFLSSNVKPELASCALQKSLNVTHTWLNKWRITASAQKSHHITFTLRKGVCPSVKLGDHALPHSECVKYLGFHIDRRLTWNEHIKHKRNALNLKYRKLTWLMGRNSVLSVDNKLLIYCSILKPIWSYGLQIWSTACKSSIMRIQRAQNGIFRDILNAPWFTRNEEIHEYLSMPTIFEEIGTVKSKYATRLSLHPNPLASELLNKSTSRLKRKPIF